MIAVQVAINGLVLGGVYALIAVGFSLVWGVLNIINILHGSFVVLGAYIAYFAFQAFGIHPFLSVPIAAAILFGLGYVLQAGIINRVVRASVLATLTLTFGLNLLLENIMLVAFKADYRNVTLDPPMGVLDLGGGISVPIDRLASALLAILLIALLYVFLTFTRNGRAVIAVRMDQDVASLMGVNTRRIYALTFGLGAMMAGASGAILAGVFPISPIMGSAYLGKAFVICVLGGLGSLPGVLVGGIALGLIESISGWSLGSESALLVSFIILLILLRFRPQGIMGKSGFQ